jgi:hypothetical protein
LAAKLFARMDPTRLPHKFLTAWVSHPRHSGGQHYTLQNSYVETLQHILPNIPDMAPSIHGCPLRRTVNSGKHSGLNGYSANKHSRSISMVLILS